MSYPLMRRVCMKARRENRTARGGDSFMEPGPCPWSKRMAGLIFPGRNWLVDAAKSLQDSGG
jgi:hypothetical protein